MMHDVSFLGDYDLEYPLEDVTISFTQNGHMYFAKICPLELRKEQVGNTTYYYTAAGKMPVKVLSEGENLKHIPPLTRGLGYTD